MHEIYRITAWFADRRRRARAARAESDRARWQQDPLSHPALRAMSASELADLPLHPGLFREDVPRRQPQVATQRHASRAGRSLCGPAWAKQ